jgi:hypothetical protein
MDSALTQLFLSLADSTLPARHAREVGAFGQQDALFKLAATKSRRLARLQDRFSARRPHRLLLGPRIADLDTDLPGWKVERLDRGFFDRTSGSDFEARTARLEDAVVIVNNNDITASAAGGLPSYCEFFSHCERTVFIGWDWDNHHWLERSTLLAAHTDMYAPAHAENLYLLTRYNACTMGPVHCATVQWSRSFLAEQLSAILQQARSDMPLGLHIPYGSFVFRNRVVGTLNQHYPTVGFSNPEFHNRSALERLREWMSHKTHWIVPVLNDVPIRIFDALATGGIPLLPQSLRHLAPACDLGEEHCVFYSPEDIIDPQHVVARANALFDRGGSYGIAARHRLAVEHHHGDSRIAEMVAMAAAQFGWSTR